MGGEADHLAGGKQVRLRQLCVIYHSPHLDINDNRSVELYVFYQSCGSALASKRIRIQGIKPNAIICQRTNKKHIQYEQYSMER
jgi:hypothetical protein